MSRTASIIRAWPIVIHLDTDMLHSVIIDNIAMPRDIFETIKSLSDKYMELNIRESFGFMNDQFDFD